MKTIALIILLGLGGSAAAGYKEAEALLKDMDPPRLAEVSKELDSLLAKPGEELAGDARAAALLGENQGAMELFRQAAEEPNDGYLFAPKPEKPVANTPAPKFAAHLKLLKLLLIEAKIKAAGKRAGPAEKNLLAAAGLMSQLSAQRSAPVLSSLVLQLCLSKAYPALSDSLRNPSAGPAYLGELAARLDKILKNQDHMRSAMLEEAEISKASILEKVTPDAMAAERAKLGFLQRLGAKKLQDQEFLDGIYRDYNAAVDAHARVMIGAFRANAPAPAAAFMEKQRQELLARKQARDQLGTAWAIKDGLKGGPGTKKVMAEVIVDSWLSATPSYEKLIPRYHLFLCELNVLRSALAVMVYRRAHKRLPDRLEQVVPAYLEAVPQDSFNKFSPLSYVRKGRNFSVYSFGPDGKDGGGTAAMDYEAYFDNPARDAGDIVFTN